MDITLLIALASLISLLIFAVGFYLSTKKPPTHAQEPQDRAGGVPLRRAQLARNRGIRLRAAQQQHNENIAAEESEPERNVDLGDAKIGAKKRAKLEAKAEKKAQREAEERLRSDRKEREKQLDEERKKIEEKERLEAKKKEEEEKRMREEKERREYEEYLKMKEAFSVEEEGFDEDEQDEQNLLQEFVNYIKNNKVVIIEDLAAHFKLKTQAALDRIKDLQNDNILTGVIDDRGKFIYVSQEEMGAVVKFIKQRGRVSISELVDHSNILINMTPKVSV
ncbi:DDRGK domain-containing protein 1 [Coccinella septempunctata]|uniref:DDRGK domain-containing protein 1 n=1 Tax=Coccinella septempunctata TaxID=41139 RepID=UPI001D08356D|nr:DDRGK domain-containing protein 1 [Coccinella septempunctata]